MLGNFGKKIGQLFFYHLVTLKIDYVPLWAEEEIEGEDIYRTKCQKYFF